jgi:hypothetical protein
MQNLTPGQKVVCSECGRVGIVAIDTFKVKGKVYSYLVVRHYEGGKTRRCVISPAKPAKTEAAKPAKPEEAEVAQLRQRVAELERENEQLRAQLAQAQAQVEQLRVALANAFNAQIALAREYERMCLKQHFIDKKGGLPPEVRETARGILSALVSEDWVAVRLGAWQALERFL